MVSTWLVHGQYVVSIWLVQHQYMLGNCINCKERCALTVPAKQREARPTSQPGVTQNADNSAWPGRQFEQLLKCRIRLLSHIAVLKFVQVAKLVASNNRGTRTSPRCTKNYVSNRRAECVSASVCFWLAGRHPTLHRTVHSTVHSTLCSLRLSKKTLKVVNTASHHYQAHPDPATQRSRVTPQREACQAAMAIGLTKFQVRQSR
jgi:hypothetical protein